MNQPFPMTRLLASLLFHVGRLYFSLPWWAILVIALAGTFAVAAYHR